MAKITNRKLEDVKQRILHEGSCLEREAFDLQIPVEELMYLLQRRCNGGTKSSTYKAILKNSEASASRISEEELAQMRGIPEPVKRRCPTVVLEESIPAEQLMQEQVVTSPVDNVAVATEYDPMDMLLDKKASLENELKFCEASLEKAKKILGIRLETVEEAKTALQKAQSFLQSVEAKAEVARIAVQMAEDKLAEGQTAIQQVTHEIEELKVNTVYLIDPWYTGPMPEYGTLLSTVELDGVTIQQVEADYLPDATLEGVLLFDYVPDFKKAREFCGLVVKYEIEGKSYKLCISDKRLKELLKMYLE